MVSSFVSPAPMQHRCQHHWSAGNQKKKRRPRGRRSPRRKFSEEQENAVPGNRTGYSMHKEVNRTGPQQYVALDCEMVGVGPGGQRSVLARVSIIDGDGTCLLDTFVRVQEKITDYRSWVSGVNPGDLTGPRAVDFGTCRMMVQALLRDKILVGHGLANDMKAVAITHPWHLIRDTANYEPFMRCDPYSGMLRAQKLRDLTRLHLGRSIQEAGSSHDSCVDAQAALDLYMSVRETWECALGLTIAKMRCMPRASPPAHYDRRSY